LVNIEGDCACMHAIHFDFQNNMTESYTYTAQHLLLLLLLLLLIIIIIIIIIIITTNNSSSHVGYYKNTSESTDVKVQNIQHGK
jgi:glucan phosphoethanolaminetransferase (alkaline phosphatase superfamily)